MSKVFKEEKSDERNFPVLFNRLQLLVQIICYDC